MKLTRGLCSCVHRSDRPARRSSLAGRSSRHRGRMARSMPRCDRQVIDGALNHLKTAYVFPETATKMSDAIRARAERKEYDSITSARAFAEALTKHLQEVSHDKHLRVLYTADPMPERRVPSPEDRARAIAEERRRNFAFERVERLDGNVGYIDLRGIQRIAGSGRDGRCGDELPRRHRRAHLRSHKEWWRFTGDDRPAFELPVRRCRAPERFLLARERRDAPVLDIATRAGAVATAPANRSTF